MAETIENLTRYVYRVDPSDRISFVSPEWLRFARENDADQLSASKVLGSTIWDHIAGHAARQLYVELFRSLRRQQTEMSIPFNCDSPTVVRNMTLTLRSTGGGAIELEGRLDHAEERQPVTILDRRAARSEEAIAICSLCRKMLVQADWVTVGEAIGRRRWLTTVPMPRLEESLCPPCRNLMG